MHMHTIKMLAKFRGAYEVQHRVTKKSGRISEGDGFLRSDDVKKVEGTESDYQIYTQTQHPGHVIEYEDQKNTIPPKMTSYQEHMCIK